MAAHKKAFAAAVSIILICALTAGCGLFNDETSKKAIFQYVEAHHDELEAFPYSVMPRNDAARAAYIRRYLGGDTIVKSVYRYNDSVLEFYCGGTGIVTSSTYSGFYYSADDLPFAFEFSDEAVFRETQEGRYEWKNEKGNKAIVTERILPHWFYYHQLWS